MAGSLFSSAVALIFAWVLIIMLSGCAQHSLAMPDGPVRQLNSAHSAPGPNELTTPAARPGA